MVKVINISLWKEYFLLCKQRLICAVILVSLWMSCSLVTLPSVHNPCLSQLYWGGGATELWFLSFLPHILAGILLQRKVFLLLFLTCHPYFYLSMLHSIAWVHWMLQLSQTGPAGTSFKVTFLLTWSPLNDSCLSDIRRYIRLILFFLCFQSKISHFSKEPSLLSEGKGI